MSRSTTIVTTGTAGAGKTYSRGACFVLDEFLTEYTGTYYSNLPLFPRRIAERHAARTGGDADEIERRIVRIPEEELSKWKRGDSGPWEYFREIDLTGCHLAFDEAHELIKNKPGDQKRRRAVDDWQEFCGQLRHRGATIEFMTQSEGKFNRQLMEEAGLKYRITNGVTERDPFCRIQMAEWYNLLAAFTGEYTPCVIQEEYRNEGARWVRKFAKKWRFDETYFELYDSFSAPSNAIAGRRRKEWWETTPRLMAPVVFVKRNLWQLLKPAAVACFLVFLLSGGGATLMSLFLWFFVGEEIDVASVQAEEVKKDVREVKPEVKRGRAGKQVDKVDPEILRLQQELKTVKALNEVVLAKREALYSHIASGAEVVLFTPGKVVLRDGTRLEPGVVVEVGPYKGRKVDEIDFENKRVVFDDGDVFSFGRYRLSSIRETIESSDDDVQRALSEIAGKPAEARDHRQPGTPLKPLR